MRTSNVGCIPAHPTIFDEATSHLDVARERRVNEAIGQLKLTRVIIANKPETIAAADRAIDLAQENSVAMAA